MNAILLYFLLLKATLVSFSGLASLPIIHNDLVVQRQLLTERELNTAVGVARMGPGPLGLYLVCVGYYVAGIPGAIAGCLAMITPAFLVIPLSRYLGRRADQPAVQRIIHSVILAAAGLLIASTIPLARDAVNNLQSAGLALVSFLILAFTKTDTAWVIVGSATFGLLSFAAFHLL
ncbi:MAG: chromate transporter [Acidimicrobiia bacterium]|nr:chromate transporter [Acidimicrobiia bacterium]